MSKLEVPAPAWQIGRVIVGLAVLAILIHTYLLGGPRDGFNPFDYFGYFTNLTASLTACTLVASGVLGLAGRSAARAVRVRAVLTACMVIVGEIYNTLVPGTGTAPAWVSVTLHIVFPVVVLIDWIFGPGRRALAWSELWIVIPYPLLWLIVVLLRGVTDGWVPYGFLLPSRGPGSLVAHVVGLLLALVVAGALVWWMSRLPHGTIPSRDAPRSRRLEAVDTERLVLRPQRAQDAAVFRVLWTERDARVPSRRRLTSDGHPTVEEIADGIRADREPGLLTVVEKRTGEVLGYCGIVFHGSGEPGEPEIAFELLRAVHGRGYATEAATAVLSQVRRLGHRRIWATVWDWNAASLRVLEKLGFVDSGVVNPLMPHGRTILTVARG
ncbi:GNAT family N-acetyltransferase [Microbacterium sp. NPDC089695]|uniref:GNAT family N-acetyltransferase n=1 Tax=Microbacterium sp. NPDC089695 TaxID=3364198 RepID=UPI00383055AE